jgi:hypothetical protein
LDAVDEAGVALLQLAGRRLVSRAAAVKCAPSWPMPQTSWSEAAAGMRVVEAVDDADGAQLGEAAAGAGDVGQQALLIRQMVTTRYWSSESAMVRSRVVR